MPKIDRQVDGREVVRRLRELSRSYRRYAKLSEFVARTNRSYAVRLRAEARAKVYREAALSMQAIVSGV
jgi:hypothetical protein